MSRSAPLLAILSLIPAGVFAAVSLDGLASESPFMPKREDNAAPAVTEGAAVEFRGMIAAKDGMLFGLYDRTRNLGAWVKQDDPGAEFKVRSYDQANDIVTLDYQGQKYSLPLSVAKIGAAAPSAVPVANAAAPAPGAAAVRVAPGAAKTDDARRLESVAAEVRRRRALRQAAATPGQAAPAGGQR